MAGKGGKGLVAGKTVDGIVDWPFSFDFFMIEVKRIDIYIWMLNLI